MHRLVKTASPVALCLLAAAAFAADPATAPAAAAPAATPPPAPDAAKMNYALGYQLGRDLGAFDLRSEDLLKGIADGRTRATPKLSPAEMQASLTAVEQHVTSQRAKEQAAAAEKAKAAGTAFLSENGKKDGVKTTASGLQYKVVKDGTGRAPTKDDNVTVHYRGTLVDGTEFDSSYKRGEPASFPVSGVIAGWTEALQLMKQGAQWQLYIPPNLAYGERGPLAGQVLIFDVELLDVGAAGPAK
jgi:FKBP-type peptidyl-prolyl cis-trans isomerase FklB